MAVNTRGAKVNKARIELYCGETTVSTSLVNAYFPYRRWLFKINPKLLFPAFRKEHRKLIIVNGRKCGWAEERYGLIPLNSHWNKAIGRFKWLKRWVRRHLGLWCNSYERGYKLIAIGHLRYIVLEAVTTSGYTACDVYSIIEQEPIGRFYFSQDLSSVYVKANREGVVQTLQVISGYVADALVYQHVALSLNRAINIFITN